MKKVKTFHILHAMDLSYEEIKKGWHMPYSHCHSHFEIYILLSGTRLVTIDNEFYKVDANTATLFKSEALHQSKGDSDFSGICLHFYRRLLDYHFKSGTVNELLSVFEYPVINLPAEYTSRLLEITKNFNCNDKNNFILLADILSTMKKYASADAVNKVSPAEKKTTGEKILDYINENYPTINSVQDIVNATGTSEATIYYTVKKATAKTPKNYINDLRITNAMRMLKYSNNNLLTIQTQCGFHSASYFFRVFKKFTGMTPLEYREKTTL